MFRLVFLCSSRRSSFTSSLLRSTPGSSLSTMKRVTRILFMPLMSMRDGIGVAMVTRAEPATATADQARPIVTNPAPARSRPVTPGTDAYAPPGTGDDSGAGDGPGAGDGSGGDAGPRAAGPARAPAAPPPQLFTGLQMSWEHSELARVSLFSGARI